MADLISRETVMLEIERRYRDYRQRSEKPLGGGCVEINHDLQMAAVAVKGVLDFMHDISAADTVEVVRCRDCAVPHNKWTGCPMLNGLVTPPDFYCGFGERRADT